MLDGKPQKYRGSPSWKCLKEELSRLTIETNYSHTMFLKCMSRLSQTTKQGTSTIHACLCQQSYHIYHSDHPKILKKTREKHSSKCKLLVRKIIYLYIWALCCISCIFTKAKLHMQIQNNSLFLLALDTADWRQWSPQQIEMMNLPSRDPDSYKNLTAFLTFPYKSFSFTYTLKLNREQIESYPFQWGYTCTARIKSLVCLAGEEKLHLLYILKYRPTRI